MSGRPGARGQGRLAREGPSIGTPATVACSMAESWSMRTRTGASGGRATPSGSIVGSQVARDTDRFPWHHDEAVAQRVDVDREECLAVLEPEGHRHPVVVERRPGAAVLSLEPLASDTPGVGRARRGTPRRS